MDDFSKIIISHKLWIFLKSLNPKALKYMFFNFFARFFVAVTQLYAISIFTNYLPKKKSFASLGCVLCEENISDVEKVISFGSSIGWYTSLVPIHSTDYSKPMGFRTFDDKLKIKEEYFAKVDTLIERVRKMQSQGYLLYDSDQYLDDIKRFVRDIPTTWRKKNKGII